MALWHHDEKDDLPKVVREWRQPERRGEWSSLAFGLACGLVGLAILLCGCAVNVGVSGINAGIQVDPGKLAPLVQPRNGR